MTSTSSPLISADSVLTSHDTDLPVVVVGAGPVGLAAAAHLLSYGLTPVVLEAGERVGAAIREWAHVRTFTPWRHLVDGAAEKLLAPTGWVRPDGDVPPTGGEIVERYLEPLAAALHPHVRTGARVVAVSRLGMDKARSVGREEAPFVVRVRDQVGDVSEITARAVVDASGTWGRPNPLGSSGLPARGEEEAEAAGLVVGPLPDVLGRDRERFAGRRTLVVGSGHSAANTLLDLVRLAEEEPGTEVVWAVRRADASRVYGGGEADQLPARGRLGTDLRAAVRGRGVEQVTGFSTTELRVAAAGDSVDVVGATPDGEGVIAGVHTVVAATGFRPDLEILGEVRVELDPGLESPVRLAPLIDPAFHSCGSVPPHGHRELAQPEPGLYVVGMKSYGRAPTFLVTTGNEQVRSVAAAIAGDLEAADEVRLVLPETGVCSVDPAREEGSPAVAIGAAAGLAVVGACCS
jgi:thioredoxin reductase